jgi:hypothetical protein
VAKLRLGGPFDFFFTTNAQRAPSQTPTARRRAFVMKKGRRQIAAVSEKPQAVGGPGLIALESGSRF